MSTGKAAFTEKIELGLCVPMTDYKFLRAYELLNSIADCSAVATYIPTNHNLVNLLSLDWIYDFNNNAIKNAIIGPSTGEDSEGIIQIRPGHTGTGITETSTYVYVNNSADTLRMNLDIDDNVIIYQRLPIGWYAYNESTKGMCSVRTPRMVSTSGHANSLLVNLSNVDDYYDIELPITDEGSINSKYAYRFSFYYRSYNEYGLNYLQPIVYYYNNQGTLLGSKEYDAQLLTVVSPTSVSEDNEFYLFQIGIPRLGLNESIPENTKRIKIVLRLTTDRFNTEGKFELAYPVLEQSFELGSSSGYISLPEPPSSFSYSSNYSEVLETTPNGKTISIDTSKICYGHVGRKLFDVKMSFSVMDVSYLSQLRMIEQQCLMGSLVALRCNHPDLPPIMKGIITVENNNTNYDYKDNSVNISFTETE